MHNVHLMKLLHPIGNVHQSLQHSPVVDALVCQEGPLSIKGGITCGFTNDEVKQHNDVLQVEVSRGHWNKERCMRAE